MNRVRELRKAVGLTQEGLAREADVSLTTVRLIEAGAVLTPRIDTARAIANALGVSVDKAFPEPGKVTA